MICLPSNAPIQLLKFHSCSYLSAIDCHSLYVVGTYKRQSHVTPFSLQEDDDAVECALSDETDERDIRSTKRPLPIKKEKLTTKKAKQEKEDILLNKATACKEKANGKEDSLDEHDIFGKYVAHELRSISNVRLQRWVKWNIQTPYILFILILDNHSKCSHFHIIFLMLFHSLYHPLQISRDIHKLGFHHLIHLCHHYPVTMTIDNTQS